MNTDPVIKELVERAERMPFYETYSKSPLKFTFCFNESWLVDLIFISSAARGFSTDFWEIFDLPRSPGNSGYAKFIRLIEAFSSRSWTTPHEGHAHSLTEKASLSRINPQSEHLFDEGYHRSTTINLDPYHPVLYPNCLRNSPHPASMIFCERQWFLIMPSTFKSSITIIDLVFANLVVNWCRKSLRTLATLAWIFAIFWANFLLFLDPFCLRAWACWARRSLAKARCKSFRWFNWLFTWNCRKGLNS